MPVYCGEVVDARLERMISPDRVHWRKVRAEVLRSEAEYPLIDRLANHLREGRNSPARDEASIYRSLKEVMGVSFQNVPTRGVVFETNHKIYNLGNARWHSPSW
ncbi:MAG TPA: hypothetical protein VIH71_10825 [Solirubrobacteraceae bacterium]